MIYGFGQTDEDPGRKEYGSGDTYFIAPAWDEGNAIATLVRQGMRVSDAYIQAGYPQLMPKPGMLECIWRNMTQISWEQTPRNINRTNRDLQRAIAGCWRGWVNGPNVSWWALSDRVTLPSGLVLPYSSFQHEILDHMNQGLPLERAYYWAAQADITPPEPLLSCMEQRIISAGVRPEPHPDVYPHPATLIDAAIECEKLPIITLPIPPGNGDGNGKDEKKGIPVKYLIGGALLLGLAFGRRS